MMRTYLSIGQVAQKTGLTIKTVRYYERIGLLPKSPRSENGYRNFSPASVRALNFIAAARKLGFSILETKQLLGLKDNKTRKSRDVNQLVQIHLLEIKNKLKMLKQLEKELKDLAQSCSNNDQPNCKILETLAFNDGD